jgi:hypothetical protein
MSATTQVLNKATGMVACCF